MGNRRKAREFALQILYQMDITKLTLTDTLNTFWHTTGDYQEEVKNFAEDLVTGTVKSLKKIDSILEKYSDHWAMERIGTIEKNIIRFATYELFERGDIPPNVTINEAVEIAKKFGTPESSHFVNGILDRIQREGQNGL